MHQVKRIIVSSFLGTCQRLLILKMVLNKSAERDGEIPTKDQHLLAKLHLKKKMSDRLFSLENTVVTGV